MRPSWRSLAGAPATYLVCTYGLTWAIWSIMLAVHGRAPIEALFGTPSAIPLIYLGAGAPTLVAIIVSGATGGRQAVLALLSRWIRLPRRPAVWLAAFGLPIALPVVALGIVAQTGFAMGPVVWPEWYLLVPPSTFALVLAGPLCEELGWRGYLQPLLLRSISPAATAVAIGTIWCFWHVPLTLTPGTTPTLVSVQQWGVYWLGAVDSSAILVCLLTAGRGSVPVAMAYHWASNASDAIVRPILPNASAEAWTNATHVELALRTVIAIGALFFLMRRPTKAQS